MSHVVLVAHSHELEVVDDGFCHPSRTPAWLSHPLPLPGDHHPAPPPAGAALYTREKQEDQILGQGMSGWDWDGDWDGEWDEELG